MLFHKDLSQNKYKVIPLARFYLKSLFRFEPLHAKLANVSVTFIKHTSLKNCI